MADTKIEKELHIMNGLLRDIRDELRKSNKPKPIQGFCPDIKTIEQMDRYYATINRSYREDPKQSFYELVDESLKNDAEYQKAVEEVVIKNNSDQI